MISLFNYDLDVLKKKYAEAKPFPHIVLDNFLPTQMAKDLERWYPEVDSKWYLYDNVFEKKRALDQLSQMPYEHAQTLAFLNTHLLINFLENITGIPGLIGDPYFRGGGLHQIEHGGLLEIHSDFNYHKDLKLDRRLNVLLYLNSDYKKEYGGELEFWDEKMERCEKRIEPLINRFVCFNTTDTSYHGHPSPWLGPQTRKSMALYYYSNGRPDVEKSDPHSTLFKKKAGAETNEEIERLRDLRNTGRLRSNVRVE